MKISICITNHNQNELVKQTIDILQYQYQKPEYIFVCSDDKPFSSKKPNVICINNKKLKGRCENRNSVITEFLNSDSDALVFIDGDSYPKDKDFIIKYEDLFEKYDLVFGTREHTDITGLKKPASDLLTANMDNLWLKKPLDNTDLRVVTKAVQDIKSGKVEYRLDKNNIIHLGFGKVSFGTEKLLENYETILEAIIKAKPAAAKGQYIRSISVSTTMGPGIYVE